MRETIATFAHRLQEDHVRKYVSERTAQQEGERGGGRARKDKGSIYFSCAHTMQEIYDVYPLRPSLCARAAPTERFRLT